MGGAEDPAGKGWFVMDRQEGDRTLAEQMIGLGPLLGVARGRTVLDLGCAEGLIALELRKAGAGFVHGVEAVASRAVVAGNLLGGDDAEIICADLDGFAELARLRLRPRYGIVLALSIAHKLKRPDLFLQQAATLTGEVLAVRLPAPVIRDQRSGNRRVPVPAVLKAGGLSFWYEAKGPRGEWVGVYRRATAAADSPSPCPLPQGEGV